MTESKARPCQKKKCLNPNLSKRIKTPNEKPVGAGASKTYFQVFSTGVPNKFVNLKMLW